MKIQLYLKAYHAYYLNEYIFAIKKYLAKFNSLNEKQIFLPLATEKYTVLRSPHADKKARDQFERVTHRRLIRITFSKSNIFNIIYVERFLSAIQAIAVGVEVRIIYISKL